MTVATDGGEAATAACAGCGADLHGPFCCRCGREANPPARDLGFLTKDAMAEALSLEGRTWHTSRDLLWRPAQLLQGYRDGTADYYFSPFKLLLVMTGVLFLFMNWTGVSLYQFLPYRTSGPIAVQLIPNGVKVTGIEYRDTLFKRHQEVITVPAVERGIDQALTQATPTQRRAVAEYRAYNAAWEDLNGFLSDWVPRIVWVLMPAYALMLGIFFHRRKFAEHMLFAIWAHSAMGAMFIILATLNLVRVPASAWLLLPAFLVLFTVAARGFYGVGWFQAALRGLGHLALYWTFAFIVIMAITLVYARDKIDLGKYLMGEGYTFVDGGTEVVVQPDAGSSR